MKIKKNKFVPFVLGVASFSTPVYLVACGTQNNAEISIQNIQSTSAKIILSYPEKTDLTAQNVASKFQVSLRQKSQESFNKVDARFRLTNNNGQKVEISLSQLNPETEYAVKIEELGGEAQKQLFLKNNVFTTTKTPQFGDLKTELPKDPSSQYAFSLKIDDASLINQQVEVKYKSDSELNNEFESIELPVSASTDQRLHVFIPSLKRDTNYTIEGLFLKKEDGKSTKVRTEGIFPIHFRTEADIVSLKVAPKKMTGQISSDLKTIRTEFIVKFANGVVNSDNVESYNLIFKVLNNTSSGGKYQKDETGKDIEYIARYESPSEEENSYIFVANLPWNQQNPVSIQLVASQNLLNTNSKKFDADIKNSDNNLKINQSILEKIISIN
ncbi:hypothetical protein [Mesomycoplasma conjunctivae]|uniref:hypothetical protein n=1 Tax=Mesomycoplasma conjunctivae TaxID=45361 RepID=UPI003DA336BF